MPNLRSGQRIKLTEEGVSAVLADNYSNRSEGDIALVEYNAVTKAVEKNDGNLQLSTEEARGLWSIQFQTARGKTYQLPGCLSETDDFTVIKEPEPTKGQQMAEKARKASNKLTPEQRAQLTNKAERLTRRAKSEYAVYALTYAEACADAEDITDKLKFAAYMRAKFPVIKQALIMSLWDDYLNELIGIGVPAKNEKAIPVRLELLLHLRKNAPGRFMRSDIEEALNDCIGHIRMVLIEKVPGFTRLAFTVKFNPQSLPNDN